MTRIKRKGFVRAKSGVCMRCKAEPCWMGKWYCWDCYKYENFESK